jgi:hypothetical protein
MPRVKAEFVRSSNVRQEPPQERCSKADQELLKRAFSHTVHVHKQAYYEARCVETPAKPSQSIFKALTTRPTESRTQSG